MIPYLLITGATMWVVGKMTEGVSDAVDTMADELTNPSNGKRMKREAAYKEWKSKQINNYDPEFNVQAQNRWNLEQRARDAGMKEVFDKKGNSRWINPNTETPQPKSRIRPGVDFTEDDFDELNK